MVGEGGGGEGGQECLDVHMQTAHEKFDVNVHHLFTKLNDQQ